MIIPPSLSTGSCIGIIATARKIAPAEVLPSITVLKDKGFKVSLGEHLYDSSHQFAGSDDERLSDLQNMLDDDSIHAILFARGGYGTVRLLDGLNLDRFRKNPKWLAGYSDVTALHSHINRYAGVATLHSAMPVNIGPEPSGDAMENVNSLLDALTGKSITYSMAKHPLDRAGEISGVLTGGNLSVLCSLNGSMSMPDTKGKVLFLEDIDEYLYHIDRMMVSLDRSGFLENLAGLVVGGMTDMNDNAVPYGASAEEIIMERVERYNFPVKFGFPAGHGSQNLAIKMGMSCLLRFESDHCIFSQA